MCRSRLIILLGPVASALGGVALGLVADQLVLYAMWQLFLRVFPQESSTPADAPKEGKNAPDDGGAAKKKNGDMDVNAKRM